ncbi:putative acetyl-CoA synthetase [Rhodococcus wratislaviensis NBRC 100605]|uniref:Putative acetyl-CoA synthetase n=2 Tax=Rhodococcus wratislaviensis TaxID=44752 RepID=X0R9C2_RHOWR|nr:putative acetyl-CoA synthetase [Rhodococcus wratislaviensis NBRC 100605]
MMPVDFADISRLVRPNRVAVVGASDRLGSLGYSTYNNVRNNSTIPGGAVPVNPGCETVLGDRCYPRVSAIPGDPVDVAIVLVGAERVLDVVKDCAVKGVRHLLILSSGFAETNDEGRRLQAEVVETARAAGIRVYGPNSPGLANIADRALLSMSPVAGEDTTTGPVGLVTQGGGLGRAVMQWMDRGLGIGLWCSPGNEADLDISDFVNHMVDDPRIRVIGTVVEGFSQGPKFVAAAQRARTAGKPIVILKIGRSEYGQKSAASHTASIAGNDAVASAVFSQHGVVRVDDIDELGETLMLFSRALGRPDIDITRTCVYSFSGGTASLAADLVGAAGLELAEFAPETAAKLAERAPDFGFSSNPVDLTTKVFTDADLNREVLGLICADDNVGSILFAMPADYGDNTVDVTRDAIDITNASGKLLIPVWMSPRLGGGHKLLEQAGLAPFASVRSLVTALSRFSEWRSHSASSTRVVEAKPLSAADESNQEPAHGTATSDRALPYDEAIELLSSDHMRFPIEVFVTDPAAAGVAADTIGGAVAVKLSAPGLIHKTEVGGVRLDLHGGSETTEAVTEMMSSERLAPFGVIPDGVFVQEMIGEGLDILLSVHSDEVFGPVLTLGAGGIATEIERDVLHLSLPFTDAEFVRALEGLRLWRKLTGFRGTQAYDIGVLCATARGLADRYLSLDGAVSEIEINPLRLIADERGTSCVALDAVALRT